MKTVAYMLAIVGGAFLIGTGQAIFSDPITLGAKNLKSGVEDVKGDPNRRSKSSTSSTIPEELPESASPETAPQEREPTPTADQDADPAVDQLDPLLDAPVPEGTLTLRESYQLWEEGAYFIDARHDYEFEAGHIEYAFFLPASLFDTDSPRALATTDQIPPDFTIVLYCVGGECDASKNTAAMLEQLGYSDLRIMGAGYSDWVNAGFPTAAGFQDNEVSP
ncbi:MAG: rhodanese-like domain-containing protein [Phycisphaerales bacterium]